MVSTADLLDFEVEEEDKKRNVQPAAADPSRSSKKDTTAEHLRTQTCSADQDYRNTDQRVATLAKHTRAEFDRCLSRDGGAARESARVCAGGSVTAVPIISFCSMGKRSLWRQKQRVSLWSFGQLPPPLLCKRHDVL